MFNNHPGQKVRILMDGDTRGQYHLIGVDFSKLTEEDEAVLVLGMNVVLNQIMERQQGKNVQEDPNYFSGSCPTCGQTFQGR